MTMTRASYEQHEAKRRGVTIEEMADKGFHSAPCRCGAPYCRGWQTVSRDRPDLIPDDIKAEEIKRFGEER